MDVTEPATAHLPTVPTTSLNQNCVHDRRANGGTTKQETVRLHADPFRVHSNSPSYCATGFDRAGPTGAIVDQTTKIVRWTLSKLTHLRSIDLSYAYYDSNIPGWQKSSPFL